jgi:hypothetical protein
MLRNIFGPKKVEVSGVGYYITRNFMIYTDHLLLG